MKMTEKKYIARRFYQEVNVIKLERGFAVELDGRLVKTPLGQPQILTSKDLAIAIAHEWASQEKIIVPETMPLTGYANSSIDRIEKNRESILKEILNFAETDLLCYRANEPIDLVSRQNSHWQPLLDWAADTMKIKLKVTTGILHIKQPLRAIDTLAKLLRGKNDMELAGIISLTTACGQIILALALAKGRIDIKEALVCTQLEQIYQNERWGVDEETRIRQVSLETEIATATKFLSLLR